MFRFGLNSEENNWKGFDIFLEKPENSCSETITWIFWRDSNFFLFFQITSWDCGGIYGDDDYVYQEVGAGAPHHKPLFLMDNVKLM